MIVSYSSFLNWKKNNLKFILISILLSCGGNPKDDQSHAGVLGNSTYLSFNSKDSATIEWDAAHNYIDTIESYTLYYHTVSDTNWRVLKSQIPQSDSPRVVIKRVEIPVDDSILFFGVTSITMEGVESDLHSCTDSTAAPPNWAVIWFRK